MHFHPRTSSPMRGANEAQRQGVRRVCRVGKRFVGWAKGLQGELCTMGRMHNRAGRILLWLLLLLLLLPAPWLVPSCQSQMTGRPGTEQGR